MNRHSRIFIAGHSGLIGSALLRRLSTDGYQNTVTRTRAALDLTDARRVDEFFAREKPEYVILAAGKVGGIEANRTLPADFIYTNLAMEMAVIHAAANHGVKRLIFFGSSCMYPRDCDQPMPESKLMTGPLEPTSEAYAMAKLAGLAMCEAYNRQHGTSFVTLIPASVYGPGDHFGDGAHVLSALLAKFHDARISGRPAVVWGTGTARREFIYADDVADACLLVMSCGTLPASIMNVGTGKDMAITELAARIQSVAGGEAATIFDTSRPDGAPHKLLDSTRLRELGWTPRVSLDVGLARSYSWYLDAVVGTSQAATVNALSRDVPMEAK